MSNEQHTDVAALANWLIAHAPTAFRDYGAACSYAAWITSLPGYDRARPLELRHNGVALTLPAPAALGGV